MAQGLLGGFALINLYMTYMLNANDLPTGDANSGFLHYYSPLALHMQRTYYVLTFLTTLFAADKYTRDQAKGWEKLPPGLVPACSAPGNSPFYALPVCCRLRIVVLAARD